MANSLELQSFPGFRMAVFWDCLHVVGILFSMTHLLRIASNYLFALGPIFSCSTKTSSIPAAFLSFVMHLLSCTLP